MAGSGDKIQGSGVEFSSLHRRTTPKAGEAARLSAGESAPPSTGEASGSSKKLPEILNPAGSGSDKSHLEGLKGKEHGEVDESAGSGSDQSHLEGLKGKEHEGVDDSAGSGSDQSHLEGLKGKEHGGAANTAGSGSDHTHLEGSKGKGTGGTTRPALRSLRYPRQLGKIKRLCYSIRDVWGWLEGVIDRLDGDFEHLCPSATRRQFWYTFLSLLLVCVYILFCGMMFHVRQTAAAYNLEDTPYSGTGHLRDGLYWTSTTITTVGFGDIVPKTTEGKIGTILVLLIGMCLMTVFCQSVNETWTVIEEFLLEELFKRFPNDDLINMIHGREVDDRGQKIMIRRFLAVFYSVVCMVVGIVIFHRYEGMEVWDAFYASITSETTLGYGDKPFTSVFGRRFAIVWLVLSTSALNRVLELQVEARLHRRSKKLMAKELNIPDLSAEGVCVNSETRKLDFFMYKLKKAKKIDEVDVKELERQFDKLWPDPNGVK